MAAVKSRPEATGLRYMGFNRNPVTMQNLEEFDKAVQDIWVNLPESQIKRTCRSFRRRINNVIKQNGGIIEWMELKTATKTALFRATV